MPERPPPPDPEEDAPLDEELDPPSDLDDDEADLAPDGDDEDLDDLDDGGDDPRDDAESDEIETEMDIDPVDEHEAPEGDGDDLDVGPDDEGLTPEDDEGLAHETEDERGGDGIEIDVDEGGDADDGGVEGTLDDPEDEVDEAALPELDADEEGDGGDDDLAGALLGDEGRAPIPWDPARWIGIAGAGAEVSVSALSIEGGRLAAVGERLLLVDEGAPSARRASYGVGASAVALTGGLLLTAGPRAHLQLSTDGGERATTLPSSSPRGASIDLAATPGRLWLRCDDALLCLSDVAHPPAVVRERDVLALAAAVATVVLLRRTRDGVALERLRSDDEGWRETPIPAPIQRMIEHPRRRLLLAAAADGRAIAVTDGVTIALSRDAGHTFATTEIGAVSALCFAGDDALAPLLVLSPERGSSPGEAAVIRLVTVTEPTRLALVPGVGDARAAMGWDASRALLWVACDAGLLALGPPRAH